MMPEINSKIPAHLHHLMPEKKGESVNKVHEQYILLQQQFTKEGEQEKSTFSNYEVCLHRLVEILHWEGDRRYLMEALPHLEPIGNMNALRAVLLRIGFKTNRKKASALRWGRSIYPCLLEFDDGPVIVTGKSKKGVYSGFDKNGACTFKWWRARKAKELYLIEAEETFNGLDNEDVGSWFYGVLHKLRRPIWGTMLLTFIANILTISTPLYTMNVYNRVINSQALDTLLYFFAGIIVAIFAEVMIRRERGRIIGFIGARVDAEITNSVFRQVLTLPLLMTESASVNKQIVQFRQFESIRDLLTGNLASTLLDLPFLFIFFGVIAFLSGWLVLIPFALVLIFGVLAVMTLPIVRRRGRKSGLNRANYNRMSMELANKMQAIRELGAEDLWFARHSRMAIVSAHSMFSARFIETALQVTGQILVMVAGLATIAIGSYLVIEGTMDTGALIAIMMIIWRILTPIQIAFLSLNRISQLKGTVKQLDRLMKIKRERRFKGRPNSLRKFEGGVKFENVSFRYGPRSEPALKGVNFEINHGEVVAISGASGSGKSTILKLLLGLYQPQAGKIFLDGINVQQLDVGEVRSSIGYMPQEMSLFYGSLAQNMLLGNPVMSREDITKALLDAGILPDDPLFEAGLDQPLRHESLSLSDASIAKITMARAYSVDGPFLLLDNPGGYLDNQADKYFIEQLARFRGKKTVIVVTSRPSHIKACDRLLQFHGGVLVNDVSVDAYIKAMDQKAGQA